VNGDAWLGTGPRAPLRPTAGGAMTYVSGAELVRQSIETILDTEPGERIMLPTFGCGLRRYLMEPNNVATRSAMQRDITDALTTWEQRIRLTGVTVEAGEDPALVLIDIRYIHVQDSRPANLVYPFYLR
jgi:Bacteriophage baseplate protein W